MAENVDMSRKHSFIWMGLYVFIGLMYLICGFLFPPGNVILDLILFLVAWLLLVPLVLLMKRRDRRRSEIAFHLEARDDFLRRQEILGDRSPTRFYK